VPAGFGIEPALAPPTFGGEVREQIKWLAFAASVVALGVSGAVIHGTLFSSGAAGSTDPFLAIFWKTPLL
jgi:hypothetical protein